MVAHGVTIELYYYSVKIKRRAEFNIKSMLPIIEIAREKFPKSFKLLKESINLGKGFNSRDLYDFFDDQGLYIEITISPSTIDANCPAFEFTIRKGDGTIIPISVSLFAYRRYKTEVSAFSNAFDLLESRLSRTV